MAVIFLGSNGSLAFMYVYNISIQQKYPFLIRIIDNLYEIDMFVFTHLVWVQIRDVSHGKKKLSFLKSAIKFKLSGWNIKLYSQDKYEFKIGIFILNGKIAWKKSYVDFFFKKKKKWVISPEQKA